MDQKYTMKKALSTITLFFFIISFNKAQTCEHLNQSFESYLDVTELYLGPDTALPPNTLLLPENHIPLARLLTIVFASIFFDDGSPEYNEIWSFGFGMESTTDAHSGDFALRIGGDENINAADVYAVNHCEGIMDSMIIHYKHIGNSPDTMSIFYWQDSTISTLPEEISEFEQFATYAYEEIIIDSTQAEFTRLALPMIKSINSYEPDTSLFLALIAGNEAFFDGGGESYFILDDLFLKKKLVDNDMDGFSSDEDCDDNNAMVNPDALEIAYNGIDDDCDPLTLDDDLDLDGYVNAEDCDDNNAMINPDALEVAYNGIDDDCDPLTLDDDLDMDGFVNAEDCDDTNAMINPDALEVAYNGLDDDCDPLTLDDDLDMDGYVNAEDCDDTNAMINPDALEVAYNGLDDDCDPLTLDDDLDMDGFNNAEDCDDTNAMINPDAEEVVYNGFDDDCDPLTLDDDLDMDGFINADDCDDRNAMVNPDAVEIPNNGIDEDCDGSDLMVGVVDVLNNNLSIYPNPAQELLNIKAEYVIKDLWVSNLSGQILLRSQVNSKRNHLQLIDLEAGTYLLTITNNENQKVNKLFVKL